MAHPKPVLDSPTTDLDAVGVVAPATVEAGSGIALDVELGTTPAVVVASIDGFTGAVAADELAALVEGRGVVGTVGLAVGRPSSLRTDVASLESHEAPAVGPT